MELAQWAFFLRFSKNYLSWFNRVSLLFDTRTYCVFQKFFLSRIKVYLCPNIINFNAVDFGERRPEEVISFFWRSVYIFSFYFKHYRQWCTTAWWHLLLDCWLLWSLWLLWFGYGRKLQRTRSARDTDTTTHKIAQGPTNPQTSSTLDLAYESIDRGSELQIDDMLHIPDNRVQSANIIELRPCPTNLQDDSLPVYDKTIPKDWKPEKQEDLTHSYLSMEDHISRGLTMAH